MENKLRFNPLDYPICFAKPDRTDTTSAWIEHIPFGMFLVDYLRPKVFVELGTHTGVSYCAFCQAVSQLGLNTSCYAVDTWKGDYLTGYYSTNILDELRKYHDPLYGNFSKLIQSTFDDAVTYFSDNTIDLLHIDGCHTYEAVKHDFEIWFPKLSNKALVLFHDTCEKQRDFGVWRLWDELKQKYLSMEFNHGHGLGVLCIGEESIPLINSLRSESINRINHISEFFSILGANLSNLIAKENEIFRIEKEISSLSSELTEKEKTVQALTSELSLKENSFQVMVSELSEKEVVRTKLENQLSELQAYTAELHKSLAFVFLRKYRMFIDKFFPSGSPIRRFYNRVILVIRNVLT